MRAPKTSLEDIIAWVKENGPAIIKEKGRRLRVEQAETICLALAGEGMKLQPYDFPSTLGVWQGHTDHGIPYSRSATSELLETLAKKAKVDLHTFDGFAVILPKLDQELFYHHPINKWGTTLSGMVQVSYRGSPSAAVLDVVMHDDDFSELRDLQPYDFPGAPKYTWQKNGAPTPTSRQVTKRLIQKLAEEKGIDWKKFEDFREILPSFTEQVFREHPINRWGTTADGVIQYAYFGSPIAAVLDLIAHDTDFEQVKDLRPEDFIHVSEGYWFKDGVPTKEARHVTKQLIVQIAKGKDWKTPEGFAKVHRFVTQEAFNKVPINRWGTVIGGMLATAYQNSPANAIRDLIAHDAECKELRVLKKEDFRYHNT